MAKIRDDKKIYCIKSSKGLIIENKEFKVE